jgi:hypothetical protein
MLPLSDNGYLRLLLAGKPVALPPVHNWLLPSEKHILVSKLSNRMQAVFFTEGMHMGLKRILPQSRSIRKVYWLGIKMRKILFELHDRGYLRLLRRGIP